MHEWYTLVGGRDKWLWIRRTHYSPMRRVCWMHSKDGGPVLKGQSSWRTISGIQVRVGTYQVIVSWRE